MAAPELKVGVVGLGAAARIVLPGLNVLPNTRLTAVADIRPDEVENFQERFDVEGYHSVEELCAKGDVNVVYVATPNQLHAEHTIIAANAGKHVICEKPMAITMDEAHRMVEAVEKNKVQYVQGHSKIFRPVFFKMAEVIRSGRLGKVIHINTFMYNDWIRRPYLASEVDEKMGGGVVFRQGPHQMDIVRFLAGGMITSLRAAVRRAFPIHDIESNYHAFLTFDNGATTLIDFNGLGHLDIAEMTWGIGEGGGLHSEADMTGPRLKPTGPVTPEERYAMPMYQFGSGGRQGEQQRLAKNQDFFGITIVSCEKGDIRQSPEGLFVYTEDGREEVEVDADINTRGFTELRELSAAIEENRPVFPNHLWGRASLEACVAMIESSRQNRELELQYQVPSPLRTSAVTA
jgi:phthalate 4,5-cis-dihydrodiol dehydrogenase